MQQLGKLNFSSISDLNFCSSQIKTQMKRKAFEEAGVSLPQPEKQVKLDPQHESPSARAQPDVQRGNSLQFLYSLFTHLFSF